MSDKRVVVVGTTTDYIDHIRQHYPGRALFVTAPAERVEATESNPAPAEELLCDLDDADQVIESLKAHLDQWGIEPSGITCFDCESLGLTAGIAQELALSFPSTTAVAVSRNKLLSKQIWRKAGLPCPDHDIARNPTDVQKFMDRVNKPIVIKPLTGSGSELVFKCINPLDCCQTFDTIRSRLAVHPDIRMYRSKANESADFDSRREFVVEEFVRGEEYSCDFVLDGDKLEIIRIAEKIAASEQPVGTTLAYVLPSKLPTRLSRKRFEEQLRNAAHALGLERSICMVDFIVCKDTAYMLEMTPRPGGDCLPLLIFRSCGLDMLGLALDFAAGNSIDIPESSSWLHLVGLRLFAPQSGIIRKIDDRDMLLDLRVRDYSLKRRIGDRVVLPPEDYDSRLLGYIVFEPLTSHQIESECYDLGSKVKIEIEPEPWLNTKAF